MQIVSVNPAHQTQGLFRSIWIVALLAGLIATAVDLVIATIATPIVHAPPDYPSFALVTLLAGCLLGAFGAAFVFTLIRRRSSRPVRTFTIVSIVVLIASYMLPIMPIVNPLPRFAGVNWGIAFTLMIIHTITAAIMVSSLLAWHRRQALSSQQLSA